ncbi:unnamed protein product [Gemmataceae bacterium]|nr:unnamed protein product [Gemmataceae bacterium]VTU00707.1 unnamed protein product [Gemmataceae bacterium]
MRSTRALPGRLAAFTLALAALIWSEPQTRAQDQPDSAAVLEKVKGGAGLAKVKEKLAADPVGARFRVDAFALNDDKALKVTGAALVPGGTDEDRAEAEKAIRAKVMAAVQDVAGAKEFSAFEFAEKAAKGDALPHVALQKAANEAGKTDRAADELKFTDAKFDAKGKLVVSGLRGANPKALAWAEAALPKVLAENPAALDADGKVAAALDLAAPKSGAEWPLSAAALQKALGVSRVRVDRAFLVARPVKADETNPSGTAWAVALTGFVIGAEKPDATAIGAGLAKAFEAAGWPAVKDADLEALTGADSRLPDPAPHIQRAVAEKPALDGVRVDARTAFGPDGKVVLAGVQPGLDDTQAAALNATVRGVLTALATGSDANPAYKRLAEFGVTSDGLEKVKFRELHAGLRKWATDSLDDVRLGRLYFDESSKLVLTCEAPDEAVKAAVERQLLDRATNTIPGFKPVAAAPVAPPVTEPKEPEKKEPEEKKDAKEPERKDVKEPEKKEPEEKKDGAVSLVAARLQAEAPKAVGGAEVRFTKFPGGLTKFLQQVVADPKNKEWDALLIERGYFDADDRYTVRGVASSEAQKKAFGDYLASLKGDPQWGPYFAPKPHAAPDLAVVPMSKLVERAQRVMPAYAAFDGIRVTGARYVLVDDKLDPGPRLVFDAQVVGRPSPAAAEALGQLTAADRAFYGRRLPKARTGEPRPVAILAVAAPAPGDTLTADQVGTYAEGFGALALLKGDLVKAKEWIDAGQWYAPHLSSVWFLSAYYHHLKGDAELARRDLYRTIELEAPLDFDGPSQRKRRYRVAKDLQGEQRDQVEKLWLAVWKDYREGAGPPAFAEPK